MCILDTHVYAHWRYVNRSHWVWNGCGPPALVPSALASWRWSQLFPSTPLPPQNPARFDISQPLATQTSGSYYSTEHATKRHFHNETSHFASAPCFLLLLSLQTWLFQHVVRFWPMTPSSPPIVRLSVHGSSRSYISWLTWNEVQ